MVNTKSVTADEVLDILSDKARQVQMHSMVAIKRGTRWYVGRVTTSAGPGGGAGMIGFHGSKDESNTGFLYLSNAEKVLILD